MPSSTIQEALLFRPDAPLTRRAFPSAQHVVLVCRLKPSLAGEAFGEEAFDAILERLERLAKAHPAFFYDGHEFKGDDVRLYVLSDNAWSLASSLAGALSDVTWCKGSVVLVCSDVGERLGKYAVAT